jgi:beta-galactosidase
MWPSRPNAEIVRLARVACALLAIAPVAHAQTVRRALSLDLGWRTIVATASSPDDAAVQFTRDDFDDRAWKPVDVPHNWDAYEGARQTRHGNLHGTAWYRRTFQINADDLADGRRAFLFFEGVGSHATVWVNGHEVGRHAGGLTTFTLDVTGAIRTDRPNTLVVRAGHPAGIRDLPWVCGGCELVYGFSEGPQPFGIIRPVTLYTTGAARIEPFGVHVWNDADATATAATVHARTEVRNRSDTPQQLTLVTTIRDAASAVVGEENESLALAAGEMRSLEHAPIAVAHPRLWSLENPHLYTVTSELRRGTVVVDRDETRFGIRTIRWPDPDGPADQPFLLNGVPTFINGTCDYEHNLGANHAFSAEQIAARVAQVRATGFNAFRDAHHPHNLRFNAAWDREGLLWWTQFGAQIWFDRDDFRANFKQLLRNWVRERRNSPSLVLWGLQNESKLPTVFAAECAAIIREMDPTASSQRLITTCNGGTGTDWDVPQNWTGTYGGDPSTYADDLRRQRLVGEYGGWRSLGLHSEGGFIDKAPFSEDRLCALLETKIRLAESVRDKVAGHFHWPFTTHANPGRNFGENGEQLFDGFRPLDRIGPANNKGLFTLWGEPTDAFHLFRANYTDGATHPMVAIMSRTWPDRWIAPGRRSGIVVTSNCDEVELFNDLGVVSLGTRTRDGRGTHFQWDDVPIEFNVLHARGRIGGKVVATDTILLHHLPAAPACAAHDRAEPDLLAPDPRGRYLLRVNCGGPDYVDVHGNTWSADRESGPFDHWGSTSWATAYPHLPPEFGSQRKIYEPVAGTRDDPLFQTFRYGRDQLRYHFTVPDGIHAVELYFTEPWYVAGGGVDCTGWRLFDVAINGATVLHDVDIWKESGGHARALKKVVPVSVKNGQLEISFPRVAAGQAVISAIAVHAGQPPDAPLNARAALGAGPGYRVSNGPVPTHTHLDLGDCVYLDSDVTLTALPPELLEAALVRTSAAARSLAAQEPFVLTLDAESDVVVAHDARLAQKPAWLAAWERTGQRAFTSGNILPGFDLLRRRVAAGTTLELGPNLAGGAADRASMYFVIVQRARPLPPAQFIEHVTSSENAGWLASGHCRPGAPQYADRAATFIALPASLSDADWLRTSQTHAETIRASFTTSAHVEVCVAIDARIAAAPAWLRDWIATTSTITTSDASASRFAVWRRRFAPGETVRLAENGRLPDGSTAAMYSVFVRPVRPSVTFALKSADAKSAEWTIAVAVGDRYGLNFRYRSAALQAIRATYDIVASDGATVCSGAFDLPASAAPGEWSVVRTRSCASMNAGTYLLRVTLPDDPPSVAFATLEVE